MRNLRDNRPEKRSLRGDCVRYWIVPGVCVFLVAITWIVFGQTLGHQFVNYDDDKYVYGNAQIKQGLSVSGLAAVLVQPHANNWHPVTSISHMLDYQIFGVKAGGHHFTNVLLHSISVLLLFFLLREMTGNVWRSAFVAALFAIHPLHVESVAWVAERKDVLSGVFFMLTLGAYVRYVGAPSLARYLTMSILFVLGLMSKPMLVTLPLVLLLVDYWPLKRIGDLRNLRQAVLEKIPLFLLSGASCVVTLLAQTTALGSSRSLPLTLRIGNALVSCVTYVWQMFWPAKLAVFYPYTYDRLPWAEILIASTFLAGVTVFAFALRKRYPYFITGWLWYLLMLIPVIGVIQVGAQAHADRYTYLPHIGLYLVITWGIVDLSARWRYRRQVLSALAGIVVVTLTWRAWVQTTYWRNSESIWTHTLAVTSNNALAHNNLGLVFQQRGRVEDAIAQYQQAIAADTGLNYRTNGVAFAHNNLGFTLLQKGQLDAATIEFEKAVTIFPDYADAHFNLGNARFEKGRIDDAIVQWEKTLSIQADDAEAHNSIGRAFLRKGQIGQAVAHYQKALEIAPHSTWALNDLAWIFATCSNASFRNGAQAIVMAQRALQFSDTENPTILRTLAAAYAESGRFNDAIDAADRALELARLQSDFALMRNLREDVDLYRTRTPLRDTLNVESPR